MLTLAQALAIFLRQPQPPWNTRGVPGDRKRGVSLRSFVNAVGNQQVVEFVEIRPTSLLNGISSLSELRAKWNSVGADQATLIQLSSVLRSVGAAIVYQSKDSRIIGIKGTNASLQGVGAIVLSDKTDPNKDVRDALGTIGQGAGAAGAGLVALAGATAATASGLPSAISTVIVLASFGVVFPFAGLTLGVGIASLTAALAAKSASRSTEEPPGSSAGDVTAGFDEIIGEVPDQLSQEVLDALIKTEFGVDPAIPEPGQLPGAGDLDPGDGGGGNIPGIGGIGAG